MTSDPVSRPRIVLLTSPNVYGALIINRLAAEPGIELVGIGLTDRVYKNKGFVATATTVLQRMGWRYTTYQFLSSNLSWPILRATGRPKQLNVLGENARYLKDVNSEETLAWLRDLRPDYIASYYFNQWIGKGVRAVPLKGCVNVHPSLLPALRGPDPCFRTIERGLMTGGVTIHSVEDGFDAGHILCQEPRDVPEKASLFGFYVIRMKEGAELLAEWLAGKKTGAGSNPSPASATNPTEDYNTYPTPKEVTRFVKSGHSLIRAGELFAAIRSVE